MKFKSQHKRFKFSETTYHMAHRDCKSIWVTAGKNCATIMSKVCDTVSEAKYFMSDPLSYSQENR